jgi:hypothetical protein
MEETMSTDAASLPPPSEVLTEYLTDLNPIPYLRAYLDGPKRPDDRRFWFDRGDRDGECLIFTEENHWVLFRIDFQDLYRSFGVSDEPGHSEAHGNDDVENGLGRLTDSAAASWLLSNGYVLPKRLRDRALDEDPEVGWSCRRSKRRLISADNQAGTTEDSNGQVATPQPEAGVSSNSNVDHPEERKRAMGWPKPIVSPLPERLDPDVRIGPLQINALTRRVCLDGASVVIDHPVAFQVFLFIAKAGGALVTAQEIRDKVPGCRKGRLDLILSRHLPDWVRALIPGRKGPQGGYALMLPEIVRNSAQSIRNSP